MELCNNQILYLFIRNAVTMTLLTPFLSTFLYPYPLSARNYLETKISLSHDSEPNETNSCKNGDIYLSNKSERNRHHEDNNGTENNSENFTKPSFDPESISGMDSCFYVSHITRITPRVYTLLTLGYIPSHCQALEKPENCIYPCNDFKKIELNVQKHSQENGNLYPPPDPMLSNTYFSVTFQYEIQIWNLQHFDLIGKLTWTNKCSNTLTPFDQLVFHMMEKGKRQIYLIFPVVNYESSTISVQILHLQSKKIAYNLQNLFRERIEKSQIFRIQFEESRDILVMNTLFELSIVDMRQKQLLLRMHPDEKCFFIDNFVCLSMNNPKYEITILSFQNSSLTFDHSLLRDDVIDAFENTNTIIQCIDITIENNNISKRIFDVKLPNMIKGTCFRIKKISNDFFFILTTAGKVYRCKFIRNNSKVVAYDYFTMDLPWNQRNNFDFRLVGSEAIVAIGGTNGRIQAIYYSDILMEDSCKFILLPDIKLQDTKESIFSCKMDSDRFGNLSIVATTESGSIYKITNRMQT